LSLRFKRLTKTGQEGYTNEKVKLETETKRKSRRLERCKDGVYYELEGINEEGYDVGGRD